MKMTIGGHTYEVAWVENTRYMDGSPALRLWDETGELISTPTVNLAEYGLHPRLGQAFIKDYSEGEGMADELERLGIVEKIERFTFGPYDTPAWRVRVLRRP